MPGFLHLINTLNFSIKERYGRIAVLNTGNKHKFVNTHTLKIGECKIIAIVIPTMYEFPNNTERYMYLNIFLLANRLHTLVVYR